MLAYGEERNRLIVLAWKTRAYRAGDRYIPKFFINFGQTIPPESELRQGTVEESSKTLRSVFWVRDDTNLARFRRWNGHQMIASLLTEKFNKDPDLVHLITLLVNTTKTFDAIYGFSPGMT